MNLSFNVCDPNFYMPKAAFLEASAGTGKTFTIEHFVIRLLLFSSLQPNEIVVITFTQKATVELVTRIHRRCLQILYGNISSDMPYISNGLSKEVLKKLELYQDIRICTIHELARTVQGCNAPLISEEMVNEMQLIIRHTLCNYQEFCHQGDVDEKKICSHSMVQQIKTIIAKPRHQHRELMSLLFDWASKNLDKNIDRAIELFHLYVDQHKKNSSSKSTFT